MKKLFGLFSSALLVGLMCVGLTNKVKEKAPEASAPRQTLEVKDVLRKGAEDGEGNVVRRNAAAPASYQMSDAKIQVTAPNDDGRVDVRFVAGIDSFDYSEARFTIIRLDENGDPHGYIEKPVTSAYMAIELDGEVKTAAEVFGEEYDYFIAYTLKGMPKSDWTKYSFEIMTELKKAEDADYVAEPHITEEIKSVNEAVYLDHLIFTWEPYNANWGHLVWENDFYAIQVDATLDPSAEDYAAGIAAALRKNIAVTLTDENGVSYSYNSIHCNGAAAATHTVNVQFSSVMTQTSVYSIDAVITYDLLDDEGNIIGQNTIKGHKEFTRLPGVENAIVTPQEDNTFVLTFDSVSNASSYTYKIYNESYNGDEISIVSGATLETATLDAGTYSIDITAFGKYNAPTTITLTDALVVENAIQILDGSDKFEFEVFHTGTAYEAIMRFRPIDEADAVTADEALQSIAVASPSKEFTSFAYKGNYTVGGVKATNAYPYYDEATGYYTMGYTHGSGLVANEIVTMSFVVKTDANAYYSINLYYYMENELAICGTSLQELYTNWLDIELSKYVSDDYSEEGWAQINKIHDDALTSLETASAEEAKGIYEAAVAEMNNVERAILVLDGQDYFDIKLYHMGSTADNLITLTPKTADCVITKDNMVDINSISVMRTDDGIERFQKFMSQTKYSVDATKAYPYYDSTLGHYVFGYKASFTNNKEFEMYFEVEDDNGQKYRFHYFYTATNPGNNVEINVELTWARDHYNALFEKNFEFFNQDCYSAETWAELSLIYNELSTGLKGNTFDTRKAEQLMDEIKAYEMDNLVAVSTEVKANWNAYTDEAENFNQNNAIIDGNNNTYWQLNSKVDGRYYLIELDKAYDFEAIEIKWYNNTNALDYDILVSTDGGETYFKVGSYAAAHLSNRIDLFSLSGAEGVTHIKIDMNVGSQYNFAIRELNLFVKK